MQRLNQRTLRALWVVLYLAIDVAYVWSSRPVYERAARAVQGSGMGGKPGVAAAAVLAYAALALGWWALVAPAIERDATLAKGAGYGLVYALAVYGVFNGTLYVMFKQWDAAITARDMAWGVTCLTAVSAAYAWACKHLSARA